MKTIASLLAATLFSIASSVYSMPANQMFSSSGWFAPTIQAKESSKPKKPKKSRTKKGGGVTFNDGSAESRAERDKRLMRECKGRPNAGACEGYTR
jgi:hypothetical protein